MGMMVCIICNYSDYVCMAEFVVYKNSEFGDGDGPIIYSNIGCRGFENSIFDCPRIDDGLFTCSRNNIAGIKCVEGKSDIDINWYNYSI